MSKTKTTSRRPAAVTDDRKGTDATAPAPEQGAVAGVWRWADFVRYGIVALAAVWGVQTIGGVGAGCVREWREFRQWRQERDGNRDETDPAENLDAWISANLPRGFRTEYAGAADAFDRVAERLRDGTIAGPRAAYAETTALLQPRITRQAWEPFLDGLLDAADLDGRQTPEQLAELWTRIAASIRRAADSAALRLAESVTRAAAAETFAAEKKSDETANEAETEESEPGETTGESPGTSNRAADGTVGATGGYRPYNYNYYAPGGMLW